MKPETKPGAVSGRQDTLDALDSPERRNLQEYREP